MTDQLIDYGCLADAVKRYKNDLYLVTKLGDETGFIDIEVSGQDDILDVFWSCPTDTVSCQRTRIDGAGYRYRVFCPAEWAEMMRHELIRGDL